MSPNLLPAVRAHAVERLRVLSRATDTYERAGRIDELQMVIALIDGLAAQAALLALAMPEPEISFAGKQPE